jgi:O-antigen ligase/polysaccharide polymerase Wzy-like membrane protein
VGFLNLEGRLAPLRDAFVVAAVAASVFFLAYADGGFATTTRAYAAIAVWWLLAVGAAAGVGRPAAGLSRFAIAASSLLALFTLWIVISSSWAPDAERVFAQFDQVLLYLGVLVLGVVMARRVPPAILVGGVAVGLAAVATVALVSRLFPSSFPQSNTTALGPLGFSRLSFPLGYWNGLGIVVALAYPLLFSFMASRRSRLAGPLAALPLPVIAADMYLASSRGAFVTATVATVVYLALSANRWTGLAATALAGVSAGAAIGYLVPRKALVDNQMNTALGVHQGHQAALVIGVISVAGALVWLGVAELARRLPAAPSVVGWATVALLVIGAVVAIAVSHPVRHFDDFKHNAVSYASSRTKVESHLLAASGNGRWQLWGSAVSEFRRHPLEGGGAGSWESWWLQHETLPTYSQFAHSLYLETLGELGIVGLLLLLAGVLAAAAGAVRSALVVRSTEVAGAAACGIAFFAAASFDWMWQLAAVAAVGIGMLGVALGSLQSRRESTTRRLGIVQPAFALVAVVALAPQVVALAAGTHLRNSQSAEAAGDVGRARAEALAAKGLEPWAASPYLQLALIDQQELQYRAAAAEIGAAIDRSRRDWTLWLAAVQIDAYRGRIAAAHRDLAHVHALYPRLQIGSATG